MGSTGGAVLYAGGNGNYPIYGLVQTWSVANTHCVAGDSGGPWITTDGSGRAAAHGQHFGFIPQYGYNYCNYVDINQLSTSLQATLLTQ